MMGNGLMMTDDTRGLKLMYVVVAKCQHQQLWRRRVRDATCTPN